MNKSRIYLLSSLLALILATTNSYAQTTTDSSADNPFLGVWRTQKKADDEESRWADVKIEPCATNAQQLCGKIVALEEPIDPETGKPKLDKHNPDNSKRDRPLMGLELMWGYEKGSNNEYDDGQIYSPRAGETYSSDMSIDPNDPNKLNVVGKVLFFSKTQTWTRVKP